MSVLPQSVALIGMGGLGCPAARILTESGIQKLSLIDADRVDLSNLQRQILFDTQAAGRLKVEVAAEKLYELSSTELEIEPIPKRLTPENALELLSDHDVILECTDDFATKFLAADAARLLKTTIVQAGAVQWRGWVLRSGQGEPCLRCVFEDIPSAEVPTCADAGVMGSVVGMVGALQAAAALTDPTQKDACLWQVDALKAELRSLSIRPRLDCPLCSGQIQNLRVERYQAA